ncbi:hypothetical protein BLA60_08650 [Actinophytocola xinjiangensis]|uniref:Uncharacterized protein n=1 Tax=Actinophytocola xinjiangensis TaxID=485602 RepID=A0A7Z0WSF6_9PSEU|nr:hypothetical protein [Actinophytocola xinjiangensis]OLF12081.1 hypothetical protein BLA60_08650 [Actinophytocola xinjiangensis]
MRKFSRRTGLAGLVTALALAMVGMANPAVAFADSCDGTYLIVGHSGSNGNPTYETLHTRNYPNPSGEFGMTAGGPLGYLALAGTIRPNGTAVYSFYNDTPTGSVLVAQFTKRAGSNGVIRQEPGVSTDPFANPGDRLRVQGYWETNAFCSPTRSLDTTLGWINFV